MPSGRNAFGARLLFLTVIGAAWLDPIPAPAQQPPRDPTAVSLIDQGLAALSGGTNLSDVTLQATVAYTSTSGPESGTGTLQALGDSYGLIVLNLPDGQYQFIRNLQTGAWIGTDGSVNLYPFSNCWTDAAWFFPGLVLASISSNLQIGVVNLGLGTWNGFSANQIQYYELVAGQPATPTALIQGYSTEQISLDPSTGLPQAIDFNAYPDDGSPGVILMEVQFSNYQTVNGMSVPLSVLEYVNGSLLLSVTVTTVTVNSGLSTSLFNIP